MNYKELKEWHFDFGLFATNPGQLVPNSKCNELLNLIIEWAENNNLGVGGGFRDYTEEEQAAIPKDAANKDSVG